MSQEAPNERQELILHTQFASSEAEPTSEALLQQLLGVIVSSATCASQALSGAASSGQLALVRTLLLHIGRSNNAQRPATRHPLFINNEPLWNLLHRSHSARCPLPCPVSDACRAAAEKGQAPCLRLLLDSCVDTMSAVTAHDAAGCTALMLAARNGHIDCIITLLEQHASVQLTAACTAPSDTTGRTLPHNATTTALMFAARKGSEQCVRLLLQHGSPVAATDAAGWTALMWAAWGGHAGCITALLEGAEDVINQQVAAVSTDRVSEQSIHYDDRYYEDGTNALMLAAAKGHVECLQLLLAHSPVAQVTAADRSGQNAILWAADKGSVKCIRQLLAHSPELQLAAGHRDRRGYTALMISADKARADCVALLLGTAAEAQVLAVIPDDMSMEADYMPGTNALMLAVMSVQQTQQAGMECVRLLLAHSPAAQALAADSDGWTALMWAAACGCSKCVAVLLSHNPSAQVAAVSSHHKSDDSGPLADFDIGYIPAGYSALMLAVKRSHLGCVRLLLQHNPEAQVAARTRAGRNALMTAANSGKVNCLTLLLAHSPSTQVMVVDGSGRRALSLAASKGHVGSVALLLEHVSCGSHLDESLVRAACSIGEAEQAAPDGVGTAGEVSKVARRRRCLELMIARGAKHPVNAQAAAVVAPIVQDLARRALVPDLAIEAVVGLANAAARCHNKKRQRMEGEAAE